MATYRLTTHSYDETLRLGARFAKYLRRGDTVCLYGDLGTGKTAFIKGMARGLGISPLKVHSPTFTLMNIYEGRIPLYHFDLYRIGAADLEGLGYEEFFYGRGVTAVEWSERLEGLVPRDHWHITLAHGGADLRRIAVTVSGKALHERFGRLMAGKGRGL